MSFDDSAHFRDALRVSLETERVAAAAPCPKCGAETKAHGERTHEGDDTRICTGPVCRAINRGIVEVPRNGPGDDRPRFPCQKCGKETLVHHTSTPMQSRQRVCSAPRCRTIVTS